MTSLPLDILPETPDYAPAIEKLHERGFGPGRFARTAFRLREGARQFEDLSFIARVGTLLVGSVRLWPIRIGESPAILLGPLAVEPAFMGRGIGTALLERSLDAARVGFRKVPQGRVTLPGPVDPNRLLICELAPGAFKGVAGPASANRA